MARRRDGHIIARITNESSEIPGRAPFLFFSAGGLTEVLNVASAATEAKEEG
jgi:hypothetical protein